MKEAFIWDDISHPAYPTEQEKTQQVKRRQFLHTMGLVGIGLALSPKCIFASVHAVDREAELWRQHVVEFVSTVVENHRRVEAIRTKLYKATLYKTQYPSGFHSSFLAPYVFSIRISQEIVICNNRFEVNQFPFYALGCPCGSPTDLNAWEIRRIINKKERREYGCVVVPTSKRHRVEYRDHADYRKTVKSYGLNPDHFEPEYKRVFRSEKKHKSYIGYGIKHKPEANGHSKRERDVLLSEKDV